jgi:hypothetical protein
MYPSINIELGRFLSIPQTEICQIIKKWYINFSMTLTRCPWPWKWLAHSNHLNLFGGFGGVVRKRNSAPILPWHVRHNRAHSYANEAEYEKFVLVKVVVNHPRYLPWKYWINYWVISKIHKNNYCHYYANELINMQIRCNVLQCIVYNPWKNYQIPPGRYGGVARKWIFVKICPNFALKQCILCKWCN